MRRSAHLSDDRLVAVWIEQTGTPAEDAHLAGCDECRARRARLERLFAEISDSAQAEADAAFSDDRLAAQRARILHRVEQDGRPARVIAFPSAPVPEIRPLRTRPAGRWIAAAAAAGLAIGLLAGQLLDLPTGARPPGVAAIRPAAPGPSSSPIRPASVAVNEEEFLGEIEMAIQGPHLAVLQPLHDLTPQ